MKKTMHIQEKRAWFILIVMTFTMLLYGVMVASFGFHLWTAAVFGLMGLAGFAALVGRKEQKAGRAILDERDREIARRSVSVSLAVFWCCFIAAAYVPWIVLGSEGILTIRAAFIPYGVFPPMALVFFVQALTTIVLYRRGENA